MESWSGRVAEWPRAHRYNHGKWKQLQATCPASKSKVMISHAMQPGTMNPFYYSVISRYVQFFHFLHVLFCLLLCISMYFAFSPFLLHLGIFSGSFRSAPGFPAAWRNLPRLHLLRLGHCRPRHIVTLTAHRHITMRSMRSMSNAAIWLTLDPFIQSHMSHMSHHSPVYIVYVHPREKHNADWSRNSSVDWCYPARELLAAD